MWSFALKFKAYKATKKKNVEDAGSMNKMEYGRIMLNIYPINCALCRKLMKKEQGNKKF